MSASGPFGPIFFGVWQSWQAPPRINRRPRSICDSADATGAAAGAGAAAGGALAGWPQPTNAATSRRPADVTATRYGDKRMDLNSSMERCTCERLKGGQKYTPLACPRLAGL